MTPAEFVIAAVLVPILAAGGLILFRYPVALLALYGLIVPFGSSLVLPIPVLPNSLRTATSLLGGIVIVRFGWEFVWGRVRSPSLPAPAALWSLYTAVAVSTLAWSVVPSETAGGLVVLFGLLTLYLVVALYPFGIADLRLFEGGVVAGAFGTATYGLMLAAVGGLPRSAAGVPRFELTGGGGGEGGDPNITAAALLLGFAVALYRTTESSGSTPSRLMYGGAAAVIAAGITLTASRGGLVGIGIVLIITLWRRGHWRVTVAVAGAIVVVLLVFPEALLLRLGDTDTTGRSGIWRNAAIACSDYCITGAGYDAFPAVHRQVYLSDPGASANRSTYEAHSIWIESLVEMGLLGLGILLAVAVITAARLLGVSRSARRGAFSAFAGLLFANSFLSNLAFKYFWLVLMYCAMVEAVAAVPGNSDRSATAFARSVDPPR